MALWVFATGCAVFSGPSRERFFEGDGTQLLHDELTAINTDLPSLKAVGSIALRIPDQRRVNERVALILQPPSQIRMAVRTISGLPLITFATEGSAVYLVDHREERFVKRSLESDPLKRLIGLSVTPENLISLICGRLPMIDFHRARRTRAPEDQLELETRWQERRYRVSYAVASPEPILIQMESIGKDGELRWRARLSGHRLIDRYRLPSRILMEGGNGSVLDLELERATVGGPVGPQLFILSPGGSGL